MFEKLKQNMLSRIEKDCVKSIIHGRVAYLKKSAGVFELVRGFPGLKGFVQSMKEWQEINPPINEDGSWNIKNAIFGGKKNLMLLIAMLIIVGMVIFQFWINFDYIETLKSNPCVEACLQNKEIW